MGESVGKDLRDKQRAVGFVDPDRGLGEVTQHDVCLVGRGSQPGFNNDIDRGELLGDLDEVFTGNRIIHGDCGHSGAAVGTGMTEGRGALLCADIGGALKLGVITENTETVGAAIVVDPLINLAGKTARHRRNGTGSRLGGRGGSGGLLVLSRLRSDDRTVRHHDDGSRVDAARLLDDHVVRRAVRQNRSGAAGENRGGLRRSALDDNRCILLDGAANNDHRLVGKGRNRQQGDAEKQAEQGNQGSPFYFHRGNLFSERSVQDGRIDSASAGSIGSISGIGSTPEETKQAVISYDRHSLPHRNQNVNKIVTNQIQNQERAFPSRKHRAAEESDPAGL